MRRAPSSTSRCFATAWREMGSRRASSVAVAGRMASQPSNRRRVGSARAANTSSAMCNQMVAYRQESRKAWRGTRAADAAPMTLIDVAIIGGGPAGLSAALMLGRCRRSAVLIDAGEQRNRAAREIHGFLTRDHVTPAELLRLARGAVAL